VWFGNDPQKKLRLTYVPAIRPWTSRRWFLPVAAVQALVGDVRSSPDLTPTAAGRSARLDRHVKLTLRVCHQCGRLRDRLEPAQRIRCQHRLRVWIRDKGGGVSERDGRVGVSDRDGSSLSRDGSNSCGCSGRSATPYPPVGLVAVLIQPPLYSGQVEPEPTSDLRVRDAILGHESANVTLSDVEQLGQLVECELGVFRDGIG
jgi:hypothetical protein